jgi:hypothetical protein
MTEIEGRTIGDPPDEGKQFIEAVNSGFSSLLTGISAVSALLEMKPRTIEKLWSLAADRTNIYRTTKAIYLERFIWTGPPAAGIQVNFVVGTIVYEFHVTESPAVVPFPIRLDRGVDIQFIYPGGALQNSTAYLIGIAG